MASLAVQLAVLAELEEPRSTIALAERMDLEEVRVEEAVSGLEEAGLVEREGFGAKTELAPVDPDLARRAGEVRAQLSAEQWQAVFEAGRAQLAYVLDRVPRLELAAYVLGEPVEAVRGEAYDLVEAGVLAAEPFQLAPSTGSLAQLLADIDALRAHRWVNEIVPEGEVLWHLGPELVFQAPGPIGHAEVGYGGASLLADQGIEVDVAGETYTRTHRELDASDAILQSLLAHPDDEDVRAACRQLYAQASTPTFAEKATIYGLAAEAKAFRAEAEDVQGGGSV